jgi:hypothetical protein
MTLLKDWSLTASTPPWLSFVAVGLAASTVILVVSLLAQRRPKATIAACALVVMMMLGGFFGFWNIEGMADNARREVKAARDNLFAQRDAIREARAERQRLRVTTAENQDRVLEELDLARQQIDNRGDERATKIKGFGHEPPTPTPPDVPRHPNFVQPPELPEPPDGRGLLLNLLSGALIAAFLGVGYIALDAGTRGHFTWSLRILTVLTFALLWALTAKLW